MTVNKQKVLTRLHVLFLVQSCLIGTGILQLPQKLSVLGYGQAFVPLYFGILATISLCIIIALCKRFPNQHLFQINETLLGKFLGKTSNVIIVLIFTTICADAINSYMRLIQSTALTESTITIPLVFFLALLVYLVRGGIFAIARFSTLTFFVAFPMVFFTGWAIQKGTITHLFPLFNLTLPQLYDATKNGFISFLGYELILFYYPYILSQRSTFKYAAIGIWLSAFFLLMTTIVSVMYFSEWQLRNIEFAVLNIFNAGEYSFIERIDMVGVTLWVFLVFSTVALYLWAANEGFKELVFQKKKGHIYVLVVIIFILLVIPISQSIKVKVFTFITDLDYLILIWPLFLLIVYFFRKKKVQL